MPRRGPLNPVAVPVEDLTTRQLLQHVVLPFQEAIAARLETVEDLVSDLTQAVQELRVAVDGVAQRLLPQIETLEERLADALADDDEAAAAVADIRTEVDRLNSLGADPQTPVDTEAEPIEPPDVIVPAEPEQPPA